MTEKYTKPCILALSAGIGCLLAALLGEIFLMLTNIRPKQPKQSVCLTIDISGSMDGSKLRQVRNASKKFVGDCDLDAFTVSLVAFDDVGEIRVRNSHNLDELLDAIDRLKSRGGTNFTAAVGTSGDVFDHSDGLAGSDAEDGQGGRKPGTGSPQTVLLFTDGQNSVGDAREAIRRAEVLREKGVDFYAVATEDADRSYLAGITGNSDRVIMVAGGDIGKAFQKAGEMILSAQLMRSDGGTCGPVLAMIQTCVWTLLLCYGIAIGLVGMQNSWLKKKFITSRQCVTLAIWCVLAGTVAGGLGQCVYHLVSLVSTGFLFGLARIVSWCILGAVMARIMVWFIPNLSTSWAWRGGLAGGFFGAVMFFFFSRGATGDVPGRLIGAFVLGACIGFIVGVIEKVCRTAWLTVVYSPRRFSQVNIGDVAVTVGSGERDTVRADGALESEVQFDMTNGIVHCLRNGQTRTIEPGTRVDVGKLHVILCTPEHPYAGGSKIAGGSGSAAPSPNAPYAFMPGPSAPQTPQSPFAPQAPVAPPVAPHTFMPGPSAPQTPQSPFAPQAPVAPSAPPVPPAPPTSASDHGGTGRKTMKLPPRS